MTEPLECYIYAYANSWNHSAITGVAIAFQNVHCQCPTKSGQILEYD
jgi:hypothetical protein